MKEEIQRLEGLLAEKQLEIEQLKNRLDKYRAAASGANDGLWDWDFEKNEGFVSTPWKTMLGMDITQDVDLMSIWEDILHPDDKANAVEKLKDYIKGNTSSYQEVFRLKHTDGTFRWILSRATALRGASGRTIRVSGSHTDITDRELAADALKRSEEKYRNLFQNSLVAMVRSHAETGSIIEANEKFWSLVGVDSEHQDDVNFDIFLNSRDKAKVLNLLLEYHAIDNLELEIKTSHSEKLWVSLSAVLYKDENIIECILKDITQTKASLLELQKVNFELDSFVYHASHDLRSPLRSILGLIDVYRLEEVQRIKEECIEKIESSVKRLDSLVLELLSISRNDRINDAHIPINLMVEINNSISSYYNASDTKGLEIITKVKQNVSFCSDLTRIRIILNNLISNALKYRSFDKDYPFIRIEAEVSKERALITVEDNGEGIEESKLPHIFDMFYRATEKSEGSGLGLYIVKKVADKLNAEIKVTSEELEGTTFVFSIPNTLL